MICEYKEDEKQVILTHITISDLLCFIYLLFHKNKEIVFSNPAERSEE